MKRKPQPLPLPSKPTTWESTKAFFKFSVTILLARITAISGFITGVVGGMDWSPLATFDWSTDFKPRQLIGMGIGIAMGGIVFEMARRRSLNS